MIPLYREHLAQICSRTNNTTSQLAASQLGVLAAAPLTVSPPPSSSFSTKATQPRSTSSLSRPQRKRLANTPQSIAQTLSSRSHLPSSYVRQRHLRAADTRLNFPRKAEVSPRLSATLHHHVLLHLRLSPPASRTTYHKMSTLSQPQTLAMAESPLREQRHSLVQTVTDQLETPSLDDRQDQRSVELITDRLELPAIDDRLYRVILLPNQLEVLLVQDADTDKASAAMDVNVGNFSDPPELAGMCHIIEHMLFMGTKKVGDLQ
jgi:hypothetical protein